MLADQGGRGAGLQELRYRDEEAVPIQGRDQLRHPQAAGNECVDVNDDENMMMQERGVMHKLKTKWWKQKGAKNCKARIL